MDTLERVLANMEKLDSIPFDHLTDPEVAGILTELTMGMSVLAEIEDDNDLRRLCQEGAALVEKIKAQNHKTPWWALWRTRSW